MADTFQDLSLSHTPLGHLTGGVAAPGEWGKFQLTPEQVEQFWRDGYISNIPVLSEEQVSKLLEDYKTFLVSALMFLDPFIVNRETSTQWKGPLFSF